MKQRQSFWPFDPYLLTFVMSYLCFSFVLHTSAHLGQWPAMFKQLMNLSIACSAMFIISFSQMRTIKRSGVLLYCLTITCLIWVYAFGHTGKGAQRWLDLGFIRFEPSELMKIALPLVLAWVLNQNHGQLSLKTTFTCLVLMSLPFLLIVKQPDLGTASIIVMIGIHSLMMTGLKARFLLYALTLGLVTAPLTWLYGLHDYQKKRIITLLFPSHDISGSGYHILQAKIAIGSGGWFGKGWNQGTQTHLDYLPEHNTDFIFALCAEEFGFIGCLILIGLMFAIIARCFILSYRGKDHFSQLAIASITFAFGLCSIINIAMVCGLIPVVGIPLPLMSYGGTTLLVTLMGFGFIHACQNNQDTLS